MPNHLYAKRPNKIASSDNVRGFEITSVRDVVAPPSGPRRAIRMTIPTRPFARWNHRTWQGKRWPVPIQMTDYEKAFLHGMRTHTRRVLEGI